MEYTKTNRKEVRGIQASEHDKYVPEFKEPGDCIEFPIWNEDTQSGMKPQKASQIAKRMGIMIPGKVFHSFVDTPKQVVCVRMRLDNELPSKEEQQEFPNQEEE